MKKLLAFLFLVSCSVATAQDTIRVCTYNVLNYSELNVGKRDIMIQRILREIKPNILIVQEVVDKWGAESISWNYALSQPGSTVHSRGFHDGPDTDHSISFTSPVNLSTSTSYHATALRDIMEMRIFRPNSIDKNIIDTLYVFSVNFTEGNTPEDIIARSKEADILKSKLPAASKDVIVGGTFNFTSPTEPGYVTLASALIDPVGQWERNSLQYLDHYSTSPRFQDTVYCGGPITGDGMDDRFDYIFYSQSMQNRYIPGSYSVYGNDGIDRRNSSIINPVNTKVDSLIAVSLFCASDHLPVYTDFVFGGSSTDIELPGLADEITLRENSEYITIFLPSPGILTITNILGQPVQILKVNGGKQQIQKAAFAPGVYFLQATTNNGTENTIRQFKFMSF